MTKVIDYLSDDMTFCIRACPMTTCLRNKVNIRVKDIPHSYADLYGTADCERLEDVEVRIHEL